MPSLLETFFIMFESNADKVKRGNEDAKQSTNKLEESLNASDRAGAAMGEHLVETFKSVAVAALAAFGVFEIASKVTEEAKLNAELGRTAERLGWAVGEVDAWNRATMIAGGKSGEFAQSLDFLNKNLAMVDATGKSRLLPFFEEMKIKATDVHGRMRPLPDLLGLIANKFKEYGAQKSAGYAEKLGISDGLLLLLRKGKDGVSELLEEIKKNGVASEEDARKAEEWRIANLELEDSLGDMARKIGSAVLPAISAALLSVKGWIEYLDKHRGLAIGFFVGVGTAVAVFYTPSIVAAAAATWALLAPILAVVIPVAALGAAFALLYDDVQNFLAGNQSLIGDLAAKWPWIGEYIHYLVRTIGSIFEWLQGIAGVVFPAIGNFMRLAWDVGLLVAVPIINMVAGAVRLLAPAFKLAADVILTVFRPVIWLFEHLGKIIGAVSDAFSWTAKQLEKGMPRLDLSGGMDYAHVTAGVRAGQSALTTANTTPFSASSPAFAGALTAGAQSRSVRVDVGGVTVNTQATDPQGVSDAVNNTLADQLRQATDHFDDGVRG